MKLDIEKISAKSQDTTKEEIARSSSRDGGLIRRFALTQPHKVPCMDYLGLERAAIYEEMKL